MISNIKYQESTSENIWPGLFLVRARDPNTIHLAIGMKIQWLAPYGAAVSSSLDQASFTQL